MGITAENFFEYIYQVIFSPKKFFENEEITCSTRLAVTNVVFITIMMKTASSIADSSIHNWSFIFSLIFSCIGALILWFLSALFFEFVAKIFNKREKLKELLFYTAFAPIPFLLFIPLNFLKGSGTIGYVLATNAQLLIYFWIIVLYALAIKSVYKLTYARSFMFIILPFIAIFFSLCWSICFFSKIWGIFSI